MSSLPVAMKIVMAMVLLSLNTLIHVATLLLIAIVKALVPAAPVRSALDRMLMAIAASWIGCNSWMLDHLTSMRIRVEGDVDLDPGGHYLVIANHQSWVDIPVLQYHFNRRIPLLRFFLKSQLFWVPLLGLAWWALDFPFMKRYSKETLARRPELAGRDREATRKACRKFSHIPVSIMNFAEGTRFTSAKHASQGSPYRHLLKPRSGGIAFVLDAMGEGLDTLLDVTIAYPGGRPTMMDLFADRIGEVRVNVRKRTIPGDLARGDYADDPEFRARFQAWINGLWTEKDQTCERLLNTSRDAPGDESGDESGNDRPGD